jgi:hypothetical protein
MPSRNELVARAGAVGIVVANYPNDSKLEQKVLFMEKNATAQTGVISTSTLTSNATAASDGDTVTVGGRTYTAKTALTETKATGTYTNASTAVAGTTITIDGITYTYFDTISATLEQPYAVLVGANPTASLANLALAIDAGATAGTNYGLGTVAHPRVSSVSSDATTIVVAYDKVGVKGNSALTSDTAAGSWGASALAGGLDPVADEVLIGSTANGAAFLDNFKAAIDNGSGQGTTYSSLCGPHEKVTATTNADTTQVVNSRDFAVMNADIATTKSAATLSWTSTVMGSGVTKTIAPVTTTYGGAAGISGDKNLI